MNIGKMIALEAKNKNICIDGFDEIKTIDDKETMIKMYFNYIDFCLCNEFPSFDFIRKHFTGIMERFGFHLNDKFTEKFTETKLKKVVALGECTGNIHLSKFSVSRLFIKHTSSVNINISDNAYTNIDIFDSAKCVITASGNARVYVSKYGDDCIVEYSKSDKSQVKIIDKHKKTY